MSTTLIFDLCVGAKSFVNKTFDTYNFYIHALAEDILWCVEIPQITCLQETPWIFNQIMNDTLIVRSWQVWHHMR